MKTRRQAPPAVRWVAVGVRVGTALALVVAIGAAWRAVPDANRAQRPSKAPSVEVPGPLPAAPAVPLTRPAALTTARQLPVARRSPSPPVAAGWTAVCGFGVVQVPPDDPDPLQRIPAAVRRSALDAMDALMLASDDTQVRAAALWMGARLRGRDVRSRIEQVARLAVASQDPFVYAIALEACKGRDPLQAGSCALLSPAQWVRLDPDNAVPWRALAAEAHERSEPQLEEDALKLAERASRSDVHIGRLPRLVEKALGQRAAPLDRTLALSAGWSAEAVWAASHGQSVSAGAGGASAQGFDLSCEGVDRNQVAMLRGPR